MVVDKGGAIAGKTLGGAGLHGLPGLFLTAVQPRGKSKAIAAPGSEYRLEEGDVLWFAGDMAGVAALRRVPGLNPQVDNQVEKLNMHKTERRLVQAVVSVRSSLVGQTVRDSRFRSTYDAVIIAVQRSGGRIQKRIGDIVLQAGMRYRLL